MAGRGSFSLSQVPEAEFLEYQRGGTQPENDRQISSRIVTDVLAGVQRSFATEGVSPDIMDKLRDLWLSKIRQLESDRPDLSVSAELDAVVAAAEEEEEDEPGSIVIAQASRLSPDEAAGPSSSAAPQLRLAAALARPSSAKGQKRVKRRKVISQFDGPNDTSDDEDDIDKEDEDDDDDDDDGDDDDDDDDVLNEDDDNDDGGPEEEPLGSGDDISDEDPEDLFDTENVVVCQYDKITRARNKWKFHLKDGIMNLNGKDYVFQRATGDAEW
ncbi:transcription initiation factor IIA subunit 1-like [Tigriopus californicus]|uniref:transcription initiation factor IIA subunit 1-like n=1 Tax=Tigriopus californicus TaxID=6832 RepID=UPI0027DA545C|nr:transcription initiation factor IIA subunit 1-like [Tigriopus californicus]